MPEVAGLAVAGVLEAAVRFGKTDSGVWNGDDMDIICHQAETEYGEVMFGGVFFQEGEKE